MKVKHGRFIITTLALAGIMALGYAISSRHAVAQNHPKTTPSAAQEEIEIKFTEVPPARRGTPDEMYPIAGAVKGLHPTDAKIVLYALGGDSWWVQPYDYAPFTEIRPNGKFESETHPGSMYAALLVNASYKPRAKLRVLPAVEGDVLARIRIPGKRE
jgi:hypothetical protein